MMEDQHDDTAFAGEIILTYMDNSAYADVECTILFTRDLTEDEAEEALNSVCTILSGRGNIALHTAHEITCRGFSLMPDDEDEPENN
jgi:hypothetical protein